MKTEKTTTPPELATTSCSARRSLATDCPCGKPKQGRIVCVDCWKSFDRRLQGRLRRCTADKTAAVAEARALAALRREPNAKAQ